MINQLLLFMTASTLMCSGCIQTEKKNTTVDSVSFVSASETAIPETIKIEFSGTDKFMIKSALFKISLYRMNEKLADTPATLITEKEYERKSVPFTIDLPIPKDVENSINPTQYYVTISWDSNGNGQAGDKGDIVIDYDKQFPNLKLNNETQKIYLKVLTSPKK